MSILYIVATPIGNLGDITLRALDILRHVPKIAAEDTRHSHKLLQHYQITTPLVAYHEHNAQAMTPRLLAHLQQGQALALISDAGTPLISDPGYLLVKAAQAAQITVTPIPGVCAAITALSVSGLPTDRFVFEGFLPARASARLAHLQSLQTETRTLIFYEAPHRIIATLAAAQAVFGTTRFACLSRELTKRYETVRQASLGELNAWLASDAEQVQGEMVLIIAGAAPLAADAIHDFTTLKILLSELPLKQAVQLAANLTGIAKNTLYDAALRINHVY